MNEDELYIGQPEIEGIIAEAEERDRAIAGAKEKVLRDGGELRGAYAFQSTGGEGIVIGTGEYERVLERFMQSYHELLALGWEPKR